MPADKLSDRQIKALKPKPRPYVVSDGRGLYVLVTPQGSKLWQHKYRFNGRERRISYGDYPTTTLAEARDFCLESRRLLRDGIDPLEYRKRAKVERQKSERTFEKLSREWLDEQTWKDNTRKRRVADFDNHLFPRLGARPIQDIGTRELGDALKALSDKPETAQRLRARCEAIFARAIAEELMQANPARELKDLNQLPAVTNSRRPFLQPDELGDFRKALDAYDGHPVYKWATQLNGFTFLRSLELRKAEWPEIDWENKTWTIPAERMKKNRHTGQRHPHIVPLAKPALDVLRKLHKFTGGEVYIFPQQGNAKKPLDENAILKVIKEIGYQGSMTGHGFRYVASTWLNEQGFNADAIEKQLAHTEVESVRDVYNLAKYMPERERMMRAWAAHLQRLAKATDTPHKGRS